jgi:transposase-like protein
MDGTYIKVAGEWAYPYRAVDQNGKTVDFLLSKRRDVRAAKTLLRHALLKHGDPLSMTLDAYAASHRAVQELKKSARRAAGAQVRKEEEGGPSTAKAKQRPARRKLRYHVDGAPYGRPHVSKEVRDEIRLSDRDL